MGAALEEAVQLVVGGAQPSSQKNWESSVTTSSERLFPSMPRVRLVTLSEARVGLDS